MNEMKTKNILEVSWKMLRIRVKRERERVEKEDLGINQSVLHLSTYLY